MFLIATFILIPLVSCKGSVPDGVRIERSKAVFSIADLGELELKRMQLESMKNYEQDAKNASVDIYNATGVRCRSMNLLSGTKDIDDESPSFFLSNIVNSGLRLEMINSTTEQNVDGTVAIYRVLEQSWKPVGGVILKTTDFRHNNPPFTLLTGYLCRV